MSSYFRSLAQRLSGASIAIRPRLGSLYEAGPALEATGLREVSLDHPVTATNRTPPATAYTPSGLPDDSTATPHPSDSSQWLPSVTPPAAPPVPLTSRNAAAERETLTSDSPSMSAQSSSHSLGHVENTALTPLPATSTAPMAFEGEPAAVPATLLPAHPRPGVVGPPRPLEITKTTPANSRTLSQLEHYHGAVATPPMLDARTQLQATGLPLLGRATEVGLLGQVSELAGQRETSSPPWQQGRSTNRFASTGRIAEYAARRSEAPDIHVTIDTIELRAIVPQAAARPSPPARSRSEGLDDYLARRRGTR